MIRRRLIDQCSAASIVLIRGWSGSGKTTLAEQLLAEWKGEITRWRPGMSSSSVRGTLFIDDAQDTSIADVAECLDAIDGRAVRTIICGRRLGAFERLAHRGDAALITADDLAFSPEETRELLGEMATFSLVRELVESTLGWAVLVDASIERLRSDPTWSPSARNGVVALLDDVVGHDDDIAMVARLPLLDDELAGAAVLDRVPMQRVGRWRKIPASIATAADRGGALPAELVGRAARRYLEFGEIDAATRLLIAECDAHQTVEILGHVSYSMLAQLDVWQLRDLVTHASASPAASIAGILLAASRAAERSDRESWGEWLAQAESRVDGGDERLRRAIVADRARHRLRGGDVSGGAYLAESLLSELPASEPITRARALVVTAMAQVYECTQLSLASATRRFREAAALFRRGEEWGWRADALARLGYTALFMAGHPEEGRQAIEEALALLPVGDWVRAYWLTNYSDVLEFLGRSVEAEAVAREAIEIGERLRDDAIIGMGYWQQSWMAANRGDLPAFRHAVGEVERHGGEWLSGGQRVEFLASTAERFLLLGDMAGYQNTMSRAVAGAEEIGLREPVELVRAGFDAIEGDASVGMNALIALEGTAAVIPVNRPRRLLLIAIAQLRMGDSGAARRTVDEAFAAAAAMGVPDLHARTNGRLLERLEAVIGAHRDEPTTVQLRLLGGFSVRQADGTSRTPQPGHPATLVKLLALNGPITNDAAIDHLWPDADATTGRARLRNLLNRLKQHAGSLIERDRDTLRLADDIEIDVIRFESAAAHSLSAPIEERVGRARQALALYAGDLLPGDAYEDWASGHRARLQRRLVSLADVVAADAERRGDFDEAARLVDLALTVEPFDENRTVRLCELLEASGRASSAGQVASRMIDTLNELGLTPMASLARFAARLN